MPSSVTFVNILAVEPDQQQALIELLNEGTERVISKRPGFISVTILASLDRRRVINVTRWESADNVKATQADPEAAELAARTAEIATPDPGIYVVAGEHTR